MVLSNFFEVVLKIFLLLFFLKKRFVDATCACIRMVGFVIAERPC